MRHGVFSAASNHSVEAGDALVLVDAGRGAVGDRDEADQQRSLIADQSDVDARSAQRVASTTRFSCAKQRAILVRRPAARPLGTRVARPAPRARRDRRPGARRRTRSSAVGFVQQARRASARAPRSARVRRAAPRLQRVERGRSGPGSMSRIRRPMYCICRRRASCVRDRARQGDRVDEPLGQVELRRAAPGRARPALRRGPAASCIACLRAVFDGAVGVRRGAGRSTSAGATRFMRGG